MAEVKCSTCGATDPKQNEYCSNGFHVAKPKYASCPKCGSQYPPDAGHNVIICAQIQRWKYPSRKLEL